MTHKELLEEFLDFEERHDLFELRIANIPIWEYLRFELFSKIKNKRVSVITSSKGKKVNNLSKAVKTFAQHALTKNPFSVNKNTDLLVFNHSRRRAYRGSYHDIHTDPFLDKLQLPYAVFENYFNWGHLKPAASGNLFYLDRFELPAAMARKLSSGVPEITDLEKMELIRAHIKEAWDVDLVDLKEQVIALIRQYKYVYPRLEKAIIKANPSKILMVVSYAVTNQIATQIAHKHNIQVIEVQHGVVGRLHVAYNYKGSPRLETVPDYFLAWGRYWMEDARIPIPRDHIKYVGFPYLDAYGKENAILRNPKQVVIISQMSQEIGLFAQKMAQKLPAYNFIFKAHPTEYEQVAEKYKTLSQQPNVTIVANDQKPLYTLFQESKFVFGVYSTALIEAVAFCEAVFVIKLPGWELFEHLKDTLNFIDTVEEAAAAIEQQNYISANRNLEQFFVQDSIAKTCHFLENL